MPSELLTQAIALIKAGQKTQARALLIQAVKANPQDEMAWLWLAETLPDDAQRIAALEQYLRINPASQRVRAAVERLRAKMTPPAAPPAETTPAEALPGQVESVEAAAPAGSQEASHPPDSQPPAPGAPPTPAKPPAKQLEAPAVRRRGAKMSKGKSISWIFVALLGVAAIIVSAWAILSLLRKPAHAINRLSASQTLAAHLATASARETLAARTPTTIQRLFETTAIGQAISQPSKTPLPSATPTPLPTHTPLPSQTPTPVVTTYPTASSNLQAANGQIAYVSDRDGSRNIFVMNPDGSAQTRLTEGLNLEPDWSPDGTRLVYSGLDGVSPESGDMEIFVMLADGSGKIALTANDANDSFPTWSPDGSQIAFVSDRDGNWELYVMNADGSNPIRLTNTPADESYPTWSANGQQIAFASAEQGRSDIYVIEMQGEKLTRLTETGDNFFPAWSPDGSRIAFVSTRGGNPAAPFDSEIFLMNADGSGVVQVTDTPAGEYYPAWSPDGQYLICSVSEFGDPPLFILDLSGQVVMRLPKGFEGMYDPDWQPILLAASP